MGPATLPLRAASFAATARQLEDAEAVFARLDDVVNTLQFEITHIHDPVQEEEEAPADPYNIEWPEYTKSKPVLLETPAEPDPEMEALLNYDFDEIDVELLGKLRLGREEEFCLPDIPDGTQGLGTASTTDAGTATSKSLTPAGSQPRTPKAPGSRKSLKSNKTFKKKKGKPEVPKVDPDVEMLRRRQELRHEHWKTEARAYGEAMTTEQKAMPEGALAVQIELMSTPKQNYELAGDSEVKTLRVHPDWTLDHLVKHAAWAFRMWPSCVLNVDKNLVTGQKVKTLSRVTLAYEKPFCFPLLADSTPGQAKPWRSWMSPEETQPLLTTRDWIEVTRRAPSLPEEWRAATAIFLRELLLLPDAPDAWEQGACGLGELAMQKSNWDELNTDVVAALVAMLERATGAALETSFERSSSDENEATTEPGAAEQDAVRPAVNDTGADLATGANQVLTRFGEAPGMRETRAVVHANISRRLEHMKLKAVEVLEGRQSSLRRAVLRALDALWTLCASSFMRKLLLHMHLPQRVLLFLHTLLDYREHSLRDPGLANAGGVEGGSKAAGAREALGAMECKCMGMLSVLLCEGEARALLPLSVCSPKFHHGAPPPAGAEEWWDHGVEEGAAASWSILARAALIVPDDKLGVATGEMRAVASRALCTALARSHAERAGFLLSHCLYFFESLLQSDCAEVLKATSAALATFREPSGCLAAVTQAAATQLLPLVLDVCCHAMEERAAQPPKKLRRLAGAVGGSELLELATSLLWPLLRAAVGEAAWAGSAVGTRQCVQVLELLEKWLACPQSTGPMVPMVLVSCLALLVAVPSHGSELMKENVVEVLQGLLSPSITPMLSDNLMVRVVACVGMLAAHHELDPNDMLPDLSVLKYFMKDAHFNRGGLHRDVLVREKMMEPLCRVISAHRHNAPMQLAAANALMFLAATYSACGWTSNQLATVVTLLASQSAVVRLQAVSTVWLLAQEPSNCFELGCLGAIERLVDVLALDPDGTASPTTEEDNSEYTVAQYFKDVPEEASTRSQKAREWAAAALWLLMHNRSNCDLLLDGPLEPEAQWQPEPDIDELLNQDPEAEELRMRRASCASRVSQSSHTSRAKDPSPARSTGNASRPPKKSDSRVSSMNKEQQSQAGDLAQGAPSTSSSSEHRMPELANFFVYELQRAASCASIDVLQAEPSRPDMSDRKAPKPVGSWRNKGRKFNNVLLYNLTHLLHTVVWTRPDFGLVLHQEGLESVLLVMALDHEAVHDLQEAAARLHLHLYAPKIGLLWRDCVEELEACRGGEQEAMLVALMQSQSWTLKQLGARGAGVLAMDARSKVWLTEGGAIPKLMGMVTHHLRRVLDVWHQESLGIEHFDELPRSTTLHQTLSLSTSALSSLSRANVPADGGAGAVAPGDANAARAESELEGGPEESATEQQQAPAPARKLTAAQQQKQEDEAKQRRQDRYMLQQQAWKKELSESYQGMRFPLRALLNLSTLAPAQVGIASIGLDPLLDLSGEGHESGVRQLSCDILNNLSCNPDNHSRMYRAELQRKALAVKISRELQASRMPHPLESPLLAPLQADLEASACTATNHHSVAVLDSRGSQFVSRCDMEMLQGKDGEVGLPSPASSRRASSRANGEDGELRQVGITFLTSLDADPGVVRPTSQHPKHPLQPIRTISPVLTRKEGRTSHPSMHHANSPVQGKVQIPPKVKTFKAKSQAFESSVMAHSALGRINWICHKGQYTLAENEQIKPAANVNSKLSEVSALPTVLPGGALGMTPVLAALADPKRTSKVNAGAPYNRLNTTLKSPPKIEQPMKGCLTARTQKLDPGWKAKRDFVEWAGNTFHMVEPHPVSHEEDEEDVAYLSGPELAVFMRKRQSLLWTEAGAAPPELLPPPPPLDLQSSTPVSRSASKSTRRPESKVSKQSKATPAPACTRAGRASKSSMALPQTTPSTSKANLRWEPPLSRVAVLSRSPSPERADWRSAEGRTDTSKTVHSRPGTDSFANTALDPAPQPSKSPLPSPRPRVKGKVKSLAAGNSKEGSRAAAEQLPSLPPSSPPADRVDSEDPQRAGTADIIPPDNQGRRKPGPGSLPRVLTPSYVMTIPKINKHYLAPTATTSSSASAAFSVVKPEPTLYDLVIGRQGKASAGGFSQFERFSVRRPLNPERTKNPRDWVSGYLREDPAHTAPPKHVFDNGVEDPLFADERNIVESWPSPSAASQRSEGTDVTGSGPDRPVDAVDTDSANEDDAQNFWDERGSQRQRRARMIRSLTSHRTTRHTPPCVCKDCMSAMADHAPEGLMALVGAERARNQFVFDRSSHKVSPGSGSQLAAWEHTQGSLVCAHLFQHYNLPNGKQGHFYHAGKRIVDEVIVNLQGRSHVPTNLTIIMQNTLPKCPKPISAALCQPAEPMPLPYRCPPELPPTPRRHTLDVVPHNCTEEGKCTQHGVVRVRPMRLLVREQVEQVITVEIQKPAPVQTAEEDEEVEVPDEPETPMHWVANESELWRTRMCHSDSLDLVDTDQVYAVGLEIDWARLSSKMPLMHEVIRHGGLSMLFQVHDVLGAHFKSLSLAYLYFSMSANAPQSGIGEVEFAHFISECHLADSSSMHCKEKDCTAIFFASSQRQDWAGYKAEETGKSSKLSRCEFVEAVIRLALAKYVIDHTAKDVASGLDKLISNNILPNLPHAAIIDPNDFRCNRLYTSEVETAFIPYLPLLQALFAAYSGPLGRIYFPQLQLFMSHAGFDSIPDVLKVTDRDTRLCFFWSCMFRADPLKSMVASNSLSFADFLECIARLSDACSLPGEEQLLAIGIPDGVFSRYPSYLQMNNDKLQEEEQRRNAEQEQEDEQLQRLGTSSSHNLLVAKSNSAMFEEANVEGDADVSETQESNNQDADDPLALFVPIGRRASASFEQQNTRPLETKLKILLDYCLEKLCDSYGVDYASEQRLELLIECLGKLYLGDD